MFEPLPPAATSGFWSSRALSQGHPSLANDKEDLVERANAVVRAEVIDRHIVVLGSGRDELPWQRVHNRFSLYELLILEVYSGNVYEGEVVQMLQFESLHGRAAAVMVLDWAFGFVRQPSLEYTRVELSIGDEFVFFLSREKDNLSSPAGMTGTLGANGVNNHFRRPFLSPECSISHLGTPFEQNLYLQSIFYLINPIQGVYHSAREDSIGNSKKVINQVELF